MILINNNNCNINNNNGNIYLDLMPVSSNYAN